MRSDLPNGIGGRTSFNYNPNIDIAPYFGTGATADDCRSPFSFLHRKVLNAGQGAGELNSRYAPTLPWSANLPTPNAENPAGSRAFGPLAYGPSRARASSASLPGNLPGTVSRQSPSVTLVANPSPSPLLPVGDDRYRYIQSRPLSSVGGAKGLGVDDEGREILIPEKPDNREVDPFEKLKQRGYPKPPQYPGNGSAIVTKLRKDYRPNHPNYHL